MYPHQEAATASSISPRTKYQWHIALLQESCAFQIDNIVKCECTPHCMSSSEVNVRGDCLLVMLLIMVLNPHLKRNKGIHNVGSCILLP